MGFFSSLFDFIKDFISTVIAAVASIFGGGPTGVLIATLAVLVISFVLIQPAAWATLMNSPWLFLTQHSILAGLVVNAMIQVVSILIPDLGRALGYVIGIVSFLMTGLTVLEYFDLYLVAPEVLLDRILPASLGLTVAEVDALYMAFTTLSLSLTVTALVTTGDVPYAQGLIDGFFAIPEGVAGVVDTVIDVAFASVSSALSSILIIGALAYFALQPGAQKVKIEGAG